MGLCTSKKSIEEIIHSKHTFARESTQNLHVKQSQHVYVWSYTADDLAQKQVRFYDSENGKYGENHGQEQVQSQQGQYLSGKPVQWPIRCHADEGYILLTVKNSTRRLQALPTENKRINNQHPSPHQVSSIDHFRKLQIPIQISQILYMIKLNSFRPYFSTQIQQEIRGLEFIAQIEIIVGDLVEKVECLKLVTIAYELEKYLQRGGQNTLKILYNEFQHIAYLITNDTNDENIESYHKHKHNCQQQQQINNNDQQTLVQNKIRIERIFRDEIHTIMNSQNYTNEQQKQIQVNKLLVEFINVVTTFNVLNNALFGDANLYNLKLIESSNQNTTDIKRDNQTMLNTELSKAILSLCINSSQVNQTNETLNIFHTIKRKNLSTKNLNLQQNFNVQEDQLNEISIIQRPKGKQMNVVKSKGQTGDIMNTSSRFICEITQIDGKSGGIELDAQLVRDNVVRFQKIKKIQDSKDRANNKIIQHQGNIQQSLLFTAEFEQLHTTKPIYPIAIIYPTQHTQHYPSQIMLTTYAGTSQFPQLKQLNVSLVINMSPWQCYNYFINDLEYDWFWLDRGVEEGQEKYAGDSDNNNKWRVDISCIVENVVNRIQSHLFQQMAKHQQQAVIINNHTHQHQKVLIFCCHNNLLYSGTIAVAYLMLSNSYRLPFDHAYASVIQSTAGRFLMPKVYEHQLRELERRVDGLSTEGNVNAFSSKVSPYRAYEVGLYTTMDDTLVVGRHIGQLNSSTQLQTLPDNTLKSYLLIPNNLTSIIIKSINNLREDGLLLTSNNDSQKIGNISKLIKNMGLTLRVFYGKELTAQQKKVYVKFVQQQLLSQLVRYEYINFPKSLFNVQKHKSKIQLIIQSLKSLITSQPIQKSFRKPQSFNQDPISIVNDMCLLKSTPSTQKSHRNQPFNSKETLTFKYPLLRPIFECKRSDNYYVMIKKFKQESNSNNLICCNVSFYRGSNWTGREEDKQRYFQKLVHSYLRDVNQQRIWIQDQQSCADDDSLFDRDSILF